MENEREERNGGIATSATVRPYRIPGPRIWNIIDNRQLMSRFCSVEYKTTIFVKVEWNNGFAWNRRTAACFTHKIRGAGGKRERYKERKKETAWDGERERCMGRKEWHTGGASHTEWQGLSLMYQQLCEDPSGIVQNWRKFKHCIHFNQTRFNSGRHAPRWPPCDSNPPCIFSTVGRLK